MNKKMLESLLIREKVEVPNDETMEVLLEIIRKHDLIEDQFVQELASIYKQALEGELSHHSPRMRFSNIATNVVKISHKNEKLRQRLLDFFR